MYLHYTELYLVRVLPRTSVYGINDASCKVFQASLATTWVSTGRTSGGRRQPPSQDCQQLCPTDSRTLQGAEGRLCNRESGCRGLISEGGGATNKGVGLLGFSLAVTLHAGY